MSPFSPPFTTSGLVNGDAVSSVTLSSPGAAETAGVAGSPYAITASNAIGMGPGNYTITYAPGTLTVTPAPLTNTAGDATKLYGAALPVLTLTYSGFVNGDSAASLTTPPTLSTTATASSPVVSGGYPITASGAADPNYTITYVPGTLTVTPATATISVSAPGGTFDGSPFPASVTLTGGGNPPGATLENVSPRLTYYAGSGTSGTNLGSTPPSAAGTYTVVAAFPGSTDYAAIQSSPITFTIAQAGATIVLTSSVGSAVYGQSVTFTATVTGVGTPTGSVTFSADGAALGTVTLDSSGKATLTTSSLAIGSHAMTATYSGDSDVHGVQSGPVAESVSQAATEIVLVPTPVFKKKKVISLGLTAEVEPLAPGGGGPTGTVAFELVKKTKNKVKLTMLGTVALSDGDALLRVKPQSVLKKSLKINYSGDTNYMASTVTPPVLTNQSLKSLARPMVARLRHTDGHTPGDGDVRQ